MKILPGEDVGTWIVFYKAQPANTIIVIKEELESELSSLTNKINLIDISSSNKDLLIWAKWRWPNSEDGLMVKIMKERLTEINKILNGITLAGG